MKRCLTSVAFWFSVVCVLGAGVVLFSYGTPAQELKSQREPERILFVGDIMLARNVETLMRARGASYPFRGIRDLFAEHDAVVGNFEASIPERHAHTPRMTFRFSVAKEVAPALARAGFTHLTLANNHAYDYGKEGYAHTREILANAGITTGGSPQTVSNNEVLYHTVGDVRVAIISINTVYKAPPLEQATAALAEAARASDVQIVSIHWGAEYELASNEAQRALARALVDAGADAIIGHHPHVVQEIEEYRGAPIFYSLGNFIFDQYWNTNVQEGLAVSLSFTGNEMRFTLVPLSSVHQKSAPKPMKRAPRTQFLTTLAGRSEESLARAIREGSIIEIFRQKNTVLK